MHEGQKKIIDAINWAVDTQEELERKAAAYQGLVRKSDLFDELVVAYRKKFAINDNPVSLMVLVDEFAALKDAGEL